MTRLRAAHLAIRLVAPLVAGAMSVSATAQGVVVTGASYAQLIDLRPLLVDSVPIAATDSAWGAFRQTANGTLVLCSSGDGWCRFQRSGARASLVAMMQDLDVTAWGFGTGMSVHAELRARTAAGDARELWPQANSALDVLAAYVDVDRDRFRARLGRQWLTSGLGLFNYDGAELVVRPWRAAGLSARVYGGGTLVEGLNRPLDAAALSPVEDLPPTDRAYLIGGGLELRPSARWAVSGQYQREIRYDRAALYSERFAADGELRFARATLGAQLTHDLATGDFNDLAAQLRVALRAGMDARLEARHYTPYFDLWTIWGAFAPVGYDEARGSLSWTAATGRLSVMGDGARRRYEATNTGVASLPLRTDGWRIGGAGALQAARSWQLQGSYHLDVGFGASQSDGDLALGWTPAERLNVRAHGSMFESIYEFRVGTGRVIGVGGEASYRLTSDLRLAADMVVYRHTGESRPQFANWNQRRASVRLAWTLGSEAGRGAGAGGAP